MELDSDGYRFLTNNRENAKQEVIHLHFHLGGGIKLITIQKRLYKVFY